MEKINKVYLTGEKETLLITLYAKALDSRSKYSILHDTAADDLVRNINYDFEKFKNFASDKIIVVRAKQYDEWLKEFLKIDPNATVINLGCGLDTRVTRINAQHVKWFDVDYPEVIELRKNFYSDGDGYKMIGSSITDINWITEIPCDQPAIIIAEGLLEYLTSDDVKTLLNRITDYFPHGQIMFDVMSSFAIKSGQSKLRDTTGAVHKWAVDSSGEVDKLNLKLRRISNLSLFKSPYIKRLSFGFRLIYGFMSLIPLYKNMLRLMRYKF